MSLEVTMPKSKASRAYVATALVAAVVLGACSRKDAAMTDTGMADTGMAAGMADTGMGPAPAVLTDANIVYILDGANHLDSLAGSIAATKGTNAEVREFGQMMMRDHHALRQQGQDLARKLGVTPAPPANDTHAADVERTTTTLNDVAKGRDFDKAYIDNEVTYHKAVLENATIAMSAAQNAEIKNLIQKAAPTIQAHLDSAQAIQSKMK
jgi:putative membrane protein